MQTTIDTAPIAALLDAANGRRRERTLSLTRILAIVEDVAAGDWERITSVGGHVPASYGYPAVTTVALCAEVDGRVRLGITTCAAISPSPGRGWACLTPWGRGKPETIAAKLRTWASRPEVLDLGPVDA